MKAIHIFRKELQHYFVSPIAYIVISVYLLVTGWFFFTPFFIFDQASLRDFFELLPVIFSFIIPAVTMRLFSEELSVGSYELLLTMPVTRNDIILGKFLAGTSFAAVMLIPTMAYPLTISFLGQLDWGPVAGGYLGALLLAAAFTAVGIFASSLTRNQIIAFIVAVIICFSLTVIDRMLFFFPPPVLDILTYLGAGEHFSNISKGVVDSRDIIYFLSVCFLGLYGTSLAIRRRT